MEGPSGGEERNNTDLWPPNAHTDLALTHAYNTEQELHYRQRSLLWLSPESQLQFHIGESFQEGAVFYPQSVKHFEKLKCW